MKYECIIFDYAGTLAYEKEGPKRWEIPGEHVELIKSLYLSGYRLAVISNSHRYGDRLWLCEKLADAGLLERFEAVVSSGVWGVHKGDPRIFLRTTQFMGVMPSRTLMVGNSEKHDGAATAVCMDYLLADLDKDGPWDKKLCLKLDDPRLGTRRNNLISDFVVIGGLKIACQVRHLNDPVSVGDVIIVGGREVKVRKVSTSPSKAEILNSSNLDLIEIAFEPVVSSSPKT